MGDLHRYRSSQRDPTIKILDDRPEPDSDSAPPASLLYDGFMMDIFRRRQGALEKRYDLELAVNGFAELMSVIYNDVADKRIQSRPSYLK